MVQQCKLGSVGKFFWSPLASLIHLQLAVDGVGSTASGSWLGCLAPLYLISFSRLAQALLHPDQILRERVSADHDLHCHCTGQSKSQDQFVFMG